MIRASFAQKVSLGNFNDQTILTAIQNHMNPTLLTIDDVTHDFVSLREAETIFGLGRTTFWRFRKRHHIEVLPGRRVSKADIIAAFAAERRGLRRAA